MYLSGTPEVDLLLLDQMDDQSLLKYCQTSTTNNDLCTVNRIKNRINLYKRYLDLKLDNYINNFDNLLSVPCIFTAESTVNDPDIFYNMIKLYIIQTNNYILIEYLGSKDENGNFESMIEYKVKNKPITIKKIIDTNPNANFSMDPGNYYNLFVNLGFKKYAKDETLEYLDMIVDADVDHGYKKYFNLIGIKLKLKLFCRFYNLIDYDIPINRNFGLQYNFDFFESDEYNDDINDMLNEIMYYYDLLYMYFNDIL